jgi:4-amino-4-deoxy-L-arabinose transferase-like glycosyltransferase
MKEWKKVLILTFAALIFRTLLFVLFNSKAVVGGDQIQIILLAKKFASGDYYGVLDPYWTPLYPIIIGILTFFVDSLELPSIIISIVAGSLAVTITYYFVEQSYGKSEAFIAGVLAIIYPHLINSVFGLGTENIYFLLIVGALFLGWNGLKSNSAKLYLLTGILLGLAYLTRPEAFGYLVFFILFAFVKDLWNGTKFSGSSIKLIATLLIGFAILATPYIGYLRAETGVWTVSGKIAANLAAGSLQENDDTAETADANENGGLHKTMIKSFVLSLIYIQKIFAFLIPILLFILVGLGLFGKTWKRERFKRETYLILFCLFTICGYALAVSETRYFYILLPIFFGWIARGILQLKGWFHKSAQDWMPDKLSFVFNTKFFVSGCLIVIYLYVFPINFFTNSTEKLWKANAYEERDAGLWLKEDSKSAPLIFSASRRPVFYAEGKQLHPTTTDIDEIYAELKNRQADYVVLGERSLKRNSFLEDFDKTLQNDPNFELVYQKNVQPGYGISIFKRK